MDAGFDVYRVEGSRYVKETEKPVSRNGTFVTTIAFSPEEDILATGGGDETITLWDTETWGEITTLIGQRARVTALEFAPESDKQLLVSRGWDGAVKLWDPSRSSVKAQVLPWPGGDPLRSVWYPDWRSGLLASAIFGRGWRSSSSYDGPAPRY